MPQDYIEKIANARNAAVALHMGSVKLAAVLAAMLEDIQKGDVYLAKYAPDFNKSLSAVAASSSALFNALEHLTGGSDE